MERIPASGPVPTSGGCARRYPIARRAAFHRILEPKGGLVLTPQPWRPGVEATAGRGRSALIAVREGPVLLLLPKSVVKVALRRAVAPLPMAVALGLPPTIPRTSTGTVGRGVGQITPSPTVPASPLRKTPPVLTTRVVLEGLTVGPTAAPRNGVNGLEAPRAAAAVPFGPAIVVLGTVRETPVRCRRIDAPVLASG